MGKKKIFMALLLGSMLLGCGKKNIIMPETDRPPIYGKKGDSYIALNDIEIIESLTKVVEGEDGSNLFKLSLNTKENDIEHIYVYYKKKGSSEKLVKSELTTLGSYNETEYYQGVFPIGDLEKLEYFIEVEDGRVRYFIGETKGYVPSEIKRFSVSKENDYTSKIGDIARGALWYGINVDTFRNGTKENDPIFNILGPEHFYPSREIFEDGSYKSDLIDSSVWRRGNIVGEFQVKEWGEDFNEEKPFEKNTSLRFSKDIGKSTRRYGGDIQGVVEKLDYLEGLGVDVISLSPVYYSYSGKKNDTIDFRHISPDFGSLRSDGVSEYRLLKDIGGKNNLGETLNKSTWSLTRSDYIFKELLDESERRGMKVVVDTNLSYVSRRFWALRDIAINGENSPYIYWFDIQYNSDKEYIYTGISSVGIIPKNGKVYRKGYIKPTNDLTPGEYEEIINWNLDHMGVEYLDNEKYYAKLNYENSELKKYLEDALGRWIDLGVDGFRIQSDGVPREFMKDLFKTLESKGDIILVEMYQKDTVSKSIGASDNYSTGALLSNYLHSGSNVNSKEFKGAMKVYNRVVDELYTKNPMILDSRSTDRFFSNLGNTKRKYDGENTKEDGYLNIRPDLLDGKSSANMNLAAGIQLTIGGAPYIYYGSELGMWGSDYPYNVKPMLWDDETFEDERDEYDLYVGTSVLKREDVSVNKVRNYIQYGVKKNSDIENFYKKLTAFRKEKKDILRYGYLTYLETKDASTGRAIDILAYERVYNEKRVVVVVNNSDKTVDTDVYTDGRGVFTEVFTKEEGRVFGKRLKVEIPGKSIRIYYN